MMMMLMKQLLRRHTITLVASQRTRASLQTGSLTAVYLLIEQSALLGIFPGLLSH